MNKNHASCWIYETSKLSFEKFNCKLIDAHWSGFSKVFWFHVQIYNKSLFHSHTQIGCNIPFNSLYLSLKTFAYLSTSSSVFPSISEAILCISFRPYFSQALRKVLKSFRLHDENPYIDQTTKLKNTSIWKSSLQKGGNSSPLLAGAPFLPSLRRSIDLLPLNIQYIIIKINSIKDKKEPKH